MVLNTLPYKVVTKFIWWHPESKDDIDEMRQWLKNNVGTPYIDWVSEASDVGPHIVVKFRTEKDALLFALKWL